MTEKSVMEQQPLTDGRLTVKGMNYWMFAFLLLPITPSM